MIFTETIPSVVTWPEIRSHCRLDDNDERDYLEGLGQACSEAFERETGIAAAKRTVTLALQPDDLTRSGIRIPKGPVVSVTSVTSSGQTVTADNYYISKSGHDFYLKFRSCSCLTEIVVVLEVGHNVVPQLIKTGVLLHLETLKNNRGATSSQQQYVNAIGLDRIYDLYRVNKAVA